jgi:hypothetical protein
MSTKVKLDIVLLVAQGTLPREDMVKTFDYCIEELGFKVLNGFLKIKNKVIGNLSIKDRVVLTISSDIEENYTRELEQIRSLYAFKSEIIQKNYLRNKKELLARKSNSESVYNNLKQELELEETRMKKALVRQKQDACDAIKDEIVEAAINNGYEVEQTVNKNNNIQLQLVRHEY